VTSPTYDKATSLIAAGRDRQALVMVACEIVDALHELTKQVGAIALPVPGMVTLDATAAPAPERIPTVDNYGPTPSLPDPGRDVLPTVKRGLGRPRRT